MSVAIEPAIQRQLAKNLLSREEAAQYLSLKPQTLAAWACNGRNDLPFVRIGRLVRYKLQDLEAFLQRHTVGAVAE